MNEEIRASAIRTGFDLVAKWEGWRERAYLCPAGVWTIGWGRTGGVKEGDRTTKEAERAWLEKRLVGDLRILEKLLSSSPRGVVQFGPRTWGALLSLVYNIGTGAFEGSTLRKELIAGNWTKAEKEWARWNRAGGKTLAGLSSRRADEWATVASELNTKPQSQVADADSTLKPDGTPA